MRRINKLFLTGCGYTILILSLFYAFAALSELVSPAIAPQQFSLILTFGLLIALAEFMYEQLKIKTVFKCLIHYCVLLVAFCFIFIMSGNITNRGPSVVFVAVILYSVLYFVIWTIVHFVRKVINAMDDKLDARTQKVEEAKKAKKPYKSLYGD